MFINFVINASIITFNLSKEPLTSHGPYVTNISFAFNTSSLYPKTINREEQKEYIAL